MIDLLTIGDSAIDLFMKVEQDSDNLNEDKKNHQICFYHGSKIPIEQYQTYIAGNACNIAVGCKKLGLSTGVYSEIGDDFNALKIINELKNSGVDTTYCVTNPKSPTNVHSVIVYKTERTIFSYHDKKNYSLKNWETPKWIYYSSLPKGFEKFQEELVNYLKQKSKIGVAFNPGTYQMKAGVLALTNILRVTDILFVNREEAAQLTSETQVQKQHKKLRALGPKLTVITDGDKGSSAYDGEEYIKAPACKNSDEIVDKTGAGDAYASGFLSAIFYGKPLKTALSWGSINAASVITKPGATHGLLNKSEIERLCKSGFREE